MSQSKPLVVIFGATGETGRVIVDSLLASNDFRVAAVARNPSNADVVKLSERGVTIHQADLLSVTQERLQEILVGADTVIATVHPSCIEAQKKIIDAAKVVGVKRVVPDDFGTDAPKGVMLMHDKKLAIRDYLKQSGVGYTFVEVGWWTQNTVPYPPDINGMHAEFSHTFVGSGDVPFAVTDLFHIGDYVRRVIADERTLNQTVFIWEDEVTLNKTWEVAVARLGDAVLQKKKVITEEMITKQLETVRAAGTEQILLRYVTEYWYSIFVRGDNTIAKAKAAGALDFKELYPDAKTYDYEYLADSFYKKPYMPYAGGYKTETLKD
ncbi:NAD(P)-binding protein [Schizophyllum commune H4-8]|uniref:NAD(P)-binding protein n=1 Tax=Schizophyllum commune (strain H4-8 / FGSC 9210) TaxID=578458 RepID=UPI00215F42DA|nr:NAD(P)-binding protein [Schizophyllum commune H4-8]KAI5889668.1 NAD(P)-binding protein [Schizophyllum commune H4-8]